MSMQTLVANDPFGLFVRDMDVTGDDVVDNDDHDRPAVLKCDFDFDCWSCI